MKKSSSGAFFWVKHVLLALVLIILAVVLIHLQQVNLSAPKPEGAPAHRNINTGLSDFYRDYRRSASPLRRDMDDFVLPVNVPLLETPMRSTVS